MAEATDSAAVNYPGLDRLPQKGNGLDPLGMQNSSVSLYQTFLRGISNVTLRYYGLYAGCAGATQSTSDLASFRRL